MFGIGFEELLLIVILIFLISPKDIPKAMKKIGQFFVAINKIKEDLFDIKKDVDSAFDDVKGEIIKDADIDKKIFKDDVYKKNIKEKKLKGKKKKKFNFIEQKNNRRI